MDSLTLLKLILHCLQYHRRHGQECGFGRNGYGNSAVKQRLPHKNTDILLMLMNLG
jgi:hypothetical protein